MIIYTQRINIRGIAVIMTSQRTVVKVDISKGGVRVILQFCAFGKLSWSRFALNLGRYKIDQSQKTNNRARNDELLSLLPTK